MRFTILLILIFTCSAYSANMQFLRNSIFTDFSKEELASFKEFVGNSLSQIPDNEVSDWTSGNGEIKGKIKPKFTHSMNGMSCRRTAFLVKMPGKNSEQYQLDICRSSEKEPWQVMRTPVEKFTKADWEMLHKVGFEALDFAGEGQPFSWFNAKTKNSGVIVPLKVTKEKDKSCRNAAISLTDKNGLSTNGVYLFCKQGAGEWQREAASLDE